MYKLYKGLLSGEVAHSYGYAMSQLFSVEVYDKDSYEKTYQKVRAEAGADADRNAQAAARSCGQAARVLPERTANAVRRYDEISRARGIDVSNMGTQAASIGSTMPSAIPNYGPMPSGKVTFGMPENKTNHYLVQTGRGPRLCSVTASGYVTCN